MRADAFSSLSQRRLRGQFIPTVSHSWSRACELTRRTGSPFQALRAEFARDQITPKPSLDFRNSRSQHRPSSMTTRRAQDHARAAPSSTNTFLSCKQEASMPQKPAYLCLQQVRRWSRAVRTMGSGLAKNPGQRTGRHGQGVAPEIQRKGCQGSRSEQRSLTGPTQTVLTKKMNLTPTWQGRPPWRWSPLHEEAMLNSVVPPDMQYWTTAESQLRHAIRPHDDTAPLEIGRPH